MNRGRFDGAGFHVLLLMMCILPLLLGTGATAFEELAGWREFRGSAEKKCLIDWLRKKGASLLGESEEAGALPCRVPEFYGRHGLFVTLLYEGKVRGCYGAFHHTTENASQVLADYLKGALLRDKRHRPLEPREFNRCRIIVTVASGKYPVSSLDTLDIGQFGVAAHCADGSIIVVVPSEIRSIQYLERMLAPHEVVQLYAFRCVTLVGEP